MASINTLTLTAGAAAVHVTVDYLGSPVSPQSIDWDLDPSLQALSVVPDATGFNFSAPAGMVPTPQPGAGIVPVTGNAMATDLSNGATANLAVLVTIAVLTFTSP